MENVSVKKNFVMNALLTIAGIIFPLISFPYVSRVLGPTGTGKVDFALSVVSYFSLFAQLGIPTYGVRACAKVRDNKIELSRTLKELLIINFVMSLISLVLFVPLVFLIPKLHAEKTLMLIVSVSILLNAIGIEYLYKGLEKYTYITIRSIVFKVIGFLALFVLIRAKSDYVIYGGISIFASSASGVMNFIHARKYVDFNVKGPYNYKRHIKAVAMFFAMSCAVTIYVNLDKVMLGFMTNDAEVGFYGSSVKIKTIMVGVVTSLGTVLLPRASYYVEQNRFKDFFRITEKALKFVFICATPLMVYFILFSKESILFVSGPEYLNAITPMKFIMPTLLFIGITNIFGIQIMVPLGKEKYVLYSEIAGAVVDLIINLLLIPSYGATGAAIGTVIAEFVVLGVQYYFLRQMSEIIPVIDSFANIKYWKIIIATCIACPCGLWTKLINIHIFDSIIHEETDLVMVNNLTYIILSGFCFFLVYYALMMLFRDEMMLDITDTVLLKIRKEKR